MKKCISACGIFTSKLKRKIIEFREILEMSPAARDPHALLLATLKGNRYIFTSNLVKQNGKK